MLFCIFDKLNVQTDELYKILHNKIDKLYFNKYCIKTQKWELNIGLNNGTWTIDCSEENFDEIFDEMVIIWDTVKGQYKAEIQMEIIDNNGKVIRKFDAN